MKRDLCWMIKTQMQGGGNYKPGAPTYDVSAPPSILHQTDWLCYFLDFKNSGDPSRPGVDFFNCGLVTRPDGDWLLARRSEWRSNMAFGFNTVTAFRMDKLNPHSPHPVGYKPMYADEHFEDPRAVYFEGKTWVSGTNFVWSPNYSGAHQILVECDDKWECIKRHDPVFGGNGISVYANKRNEKNWVWFFYEGRPHMVYMSLPLMIASFTNTFGSTHVYQDRPAGFDWAYGEPRAGTPPMLVDDEYWVFFHSSVHSDRFNKRHYHMGAYAFESKPPFRMTRCTNKPLLSGSNVDRGGGDKPLVVFPCGTIFRNGFWLISMGINDLDCAIIRIPHDELVPRTKQFIKTQTLVTV